MTETEGDPFIFPRERESTVRQAVSTERGTVRLAVWLRVGETRRDDGRCIFFGERVSPNLKVLNSHVRKRSETDQVGMKMLWFKYRDFLPFLEFWYRISC